MTLLLAGCDSVNSGEAGEESATQYRIDQTYDETRNGVRLVISYDSANDLFSGTVENTTSNTIPQVRVEVHLSNGTELGPTTPGDLAASATRPVTLANTSTVPFTTWSAHPETGAGGGEGSGEHGNGGDSGGS